ncbi:MAG: 30S ribosomal protein THX [Ferruginibacter sp.]
MGRGDIKTKKGKITAGSFGKSRPAKSKATVAKNEAAKKAAPAKKA